MPLFILKFEKGVQLTRLQILSPSGILEHLKKSNSSKIVSKFFTFSGESFVINFIRVLKLRSFFAFNDRATPTFFRPDFNLNFEESSELKIYDRDFV